MILSGKFRKVVFGFVFVLAVVGHCGTSYADDFLKTNFTGQGSNAVDLLKSLRELQGAEGGQKLFNCQVGVEIVQDSDDCVRNCGVRASVFITTIPFHSSDPSRGKDAYLDISIAQSDLHGRGLQPVVEVYKQVTTVGQKNITALVLQRDEESKIVSLEVIEYQFPSLKERMHIKCSHWF